MTSTKKGLGIFDSQAPISMTDKFLVPPFSVLNAREGYWKARKNKWLSLGIQSEIGRENSDTSCATEWMKRGAENNGKQIGISVFDPVMCELAYRWFCPAGGLVLDPFAGGSVRGVVAAILGFDYVGIDLREEQIEANKAQWWAIAHENAVTKTPTWIVGDSRKVKKHFAGIGRADFIFSCPPYGDLEVYSDDPQDISNLSYDEFIIAYQTIIKRTCALLKPGRFACFVVGDFRNKQGFYQQFPNHTINCFNKAGLELYNEAILLTAIGSLPLRAGKQFMSSRKLGKTHQNILVFYKGKDHKEIKELFKGGKI